MSLYGGLAGTYSPDDNKLRLYAVARLDAELYERVRAVGFRWAAKQGLFVAPAWTPEREDLLLELCGEIEDEDGSIMDRAEDRADRFENYQGKRAREANAAADAVEELAGSIPMGQPILVGHHSEKRARRDAKRIENGMRKAVRLWDTSEYWRSRASACVQHARYLERTDVRLRRIKRLEAEERKNARTADRAQTFADAWSKAKPTRENLRKLANFDHVSRCFPLADYPRSVTASQYEGSMGLWSALGETDADAIVSPAQAVEISTSAHACTLAWCARWATHYARRLEYERAMLGDYQAPAKPKRPKLAPLLNYRAPDGVSVVNRYTHGETYVRPQVECTRAEYKRIPGDFKATCVSADGSHRVRGAMGQRFGAGNGLVCVFLTDSKEHENPTPAAPAVPEGRLFA